MTKQNKTSHLIFNYSVLGKKRPIIDMKRQKFGKNQKALNKV